MEPNTGVTFSDVAGVDEAKQDFQEVGPSPAAGPALHAAVGPRIPAPRLLPPHCALMLVLFEDPHSTTHKSHNHHPTPAHPSTRPATHLTHPPCRLLSS